MKKKLKEWTRRYLPAEIISIITTLAAAGLAYSFSGNLITTALAATWGGNIGYFGFILLIDVQQVRKHCRLLKKPYTNNLFLKNIKALVIEFGVAEITDSFFIRPALMYYLPILFGNLPLGILIAKLVADITFYVTAITSYELSKKYLRNKTG
jgi:hypothetical protein